MPPLSSYFSGKRALRIEALEPRCFLSATTSVADYDFFVSDAADSLVSSQRVSSADFARMIGLDQVAADYGFTGSGQTVAMIDTGIAYDHAALGGGYGSGYRVVGGYDFAEKDANPYDDGPSGSHGTHVAGIISSTNARCPGIAQGADVVSLRVFNDEGKGLFNWVEQALQWVHTHRDSFENPITTVSLSLGTSYNGDSLPSWAMLEDEFALLEADGIFISVAAGNAFAAYNTTGLSYPAVSTHVVPVASVDANGSLSYFSQRDERVIAAPGRSILSTVPDYKGDQNGVADDYAMYSGTSMAAPCVAGASMLLRQAYAFAGIANVNQQMLYTTMFATADLIYDAVTSAYYHRLNIDRAIDSIIPDDDFGSSAADAHGLGTLADTLSLDGAIGSVSDCDWFSFKAGASGTVSIAFGGNDTQTPHWEFATKPADIAIDGNTITFSVVAGQTYSFGLSTGGDVARYHLDLDLDPIVVSLPTCSVKTVDQTIVISGTSGNDMVSIVVADTYRMTVNGVEYRYNPRAVRTIVFEGNGGNDTITVEVKQTNVFASLWPGKLDLDCSGLKIHTTDVENASVRAGSGLSRAVLYDSYGDDTLTATPTSTELRGPGFVNRVEGFSSTTAVARRGNDVAWLFDSADNDTLTVSPTETALSGRRFSIAARYFDEVHANGDAGGRDVAYLCNMDDTVQLRAAGKKAQLWFTDSSTDSLTLQDNATLTGFERVRVLPYRGKTLRSEVGAIDFVLNILGRQA